MYTGFHSLISPFGDQCLEQFLLFDQGSSFVVLKAHKCQVDYA